jgi:Protein of unknown function (DUF4446)
VILSSKTLTLLVLVSLGLNVLALFLLVATRGRARGRASLPTSALAIDDVLRGLLEGHAQAVRRLEEAVHRLNLEDQRLGERLSGAVQRVGLLRFDAFEDVGGRLSFSCALLDEQGDGVVITSINGRQDTRVYAKPVTAGSSDHNLSEEEEEAIRIAVERPRESVEAR